MPSQNPIRSTRVFAALAVLACTVATGSATAAPPIRSVVHSMVVRFADLDLAHAKDVATLYSRIEQAARALCLDDSFSPDPSHARNMKLCVDAVMAQAINDINRSPLTALHHSKVRRGAAPTDLIQRRDASR
jgi:UrcA family protein